MKTGRWCVCPVAFYHLALDTGLEAEEQPGYFTVTNASKPISALLGNHRSLLVPSSSNGNGNISVILCHHPFISLIAKPICLLSYSNPLPGTVGLLHRLFVLGLVPRLYVTRRMQMGQDERCG